MARVVMMSILFIAAGYHAAALRDVPKGECYECEVTCFEDCALKFDREIIQTDLLQLGSGEKKNHTVELTEEYGQCLQDDKCPCPKEAAKAQGKLGLIEAGKKRGKCAVGQGSCSQKCGQKVVNQDIAKLSKQKSLLQKDFPLHSVKINAFAKGAMNMDQCLKYCLAATCGCDDAPGFQGSAERLNAAVEANAAAGTPVTDTPKSMQYKPAKIEECAKGMIGKKVASGLFIKLEGGPGGMYEVCSKDFLSKLLGPSGDVDGYTAKCKSGASDMSKFGCVWDAEKDVCVVGFSPILRCQVGYTDDTTL